MPLREAFKQATDEDLAKVLADGYLGAQAGSVTTVNGETQTVVYQNEARRRRKEVGARLKWWRDQGADLVKGLVAALFDSEKVIEQRQRFARMATAHNPSKRLTDEVSNLYEEPPLRTFKGRATMEEAYRKTAEEVQLDELMQEAQPLAFLCSAVMFWGVKSEATQRDSLRLVTLDECDPVPHPADKLHMAGVILDCAPASSLPAGQREQLKHFEVWDERYVLELNASGSVVRPRYEHGLGRIPGFLAHARKPTEKLVEWERGGDITAAHEAVVFLNLLALRLAKSQGENQPILTGDLARMASGQPADGESPLALPPGVTVEMLQTKTDPEHYLKLLRHFISGVAQTYGMSYEQFTNSDTADTASGRAYAVRRQKLSEIRSQQRRRWSRHEREVVVLLGFDPTGFHADYHDPAMPQDPMEELDVEEKRWRLGQSNPAAFLRKTNPDIQSDEEAMVQVLTNVAITSSLWSLLRKANAPADADAVDGGQSAQENGAKGPAAKAAKNAQPGDETDTPPPGETGGAGGREPQSRMATGASEPG